MELDAQFRDDICAAMEIIASEYSEVRYRAGWLLGIEDILEQDTTSDEGKLLHRLAERVGGWGAWLEWLKRHDH